jgi:hypothetical protein
MGYRVVVATMSPRQSESTRTHGGDVAPKIGGKYVTSGAALSCKESAGSQQALEGVSRRMKSAPSRVCTATVVSRLATEDQTMRAAKHDLVVQQVDGADVNGCKHNLLPLAILVLAEPQGFGHLTQLAQPWASLRGAHPAQNGRKVVRSGAVFFQVPSHYRGI